MTHLWHNTCYNLGNGEKTMKTAKKLLVLCAAFVLAGCSGANQGVKLTLENAKDYLQYPVENQGNANFDEDAKTVSFKIYPNSEKGKLFSSDITGKCNISVKYATGYDIGTGFIWSETYEQKGVALSFKAGGTNPDSGSEMMDALEGTFTYTVEFNFSVVNVFNLEVTEISGHMKA